MPSSSMSILCAVASWMPLMVLPPGPMSRPIFSGWMWIMSSRGARGLMSVRGKRKVVTMCLRISRRASRAWSSVARMIFSSMPSILRSSWMPVMPRRCRPP